MDKCFQIPQHRGGALYIFCLTLDCKRIISVTSLLVPIMGAIYKAYYAKKMGVPVNKLICASNANNVLTDFINTGTYDRNRDFYLTMSPSMDILVSSNLERLLYLMSGCDTALVSSLMEQLNREGSYTVPEDLLAVIQKEFWAECCDDIQARAAIGQVWQQHKCGED